MASYEVFTAGGDTLRLESDRMERDGSGALVFTRQDGIEVGYFPAGSYQYCFEIDLLQSLRAGEKPSPRERG